MAEGDIFPITRGLLEETNVFDDTNAGPPLCAMRIHRSNLEVRLIETAYELRVNDREVKEAVLKVGDLVKIDFFAIEVIEAPAVIEGVDGHKTVFIDFDTGEERQQQSKPSVGSKSVKTRGSVVTHSYPSFDLTRFSKLIEGSMGSSSALVTALAAVFLGLFYFASTVAPGGFVQVSVMDLPPTKQELEAAEARPQMPTASQFQAQAQNQASIPVLRAPMSEAKPTTAAAKPRREFWSATPAPKAAESKPSRRATREVASTRSRSSSSAKASKPKGHPTERFFAAIRGGEVSTLRRMVSSGEIDPNTATSFGRTPLMQAVQSGQNDCVRYLLSVANLRQLNAQDANGDTALMYAARQKRDEIAKLLVERGADATIKSKAGESPAEVAFLNDRTAMAKLLETAAARRPASH